MHNISSGTLPLVQCMGSGMQIERVDLGLRRRSAGGGGVRK